MGDAEPASPESRLQQFLTLTLAARFDQHDRQALARHLEVNPGDIVLRASTHEAEAAEYAKYFCLRNRANDLATAIIRERLSSARNALTKALAQRMSKEERDEFVREMGVSPGDVCLSPRTAGEHAGEIVAYFERRGPTGFGLTRLILKMVYRGLLETL